MLSPPDSPANNCLLAALPPDAYAQLKAYWEPIELAAAEYLQVPGDPQHYVYFPTGAVIILVCQIVQRPPLAVGLVGFEGFVGLPVFLGSQNPRWGAQVQLSGTALRLPAEVLRQSCKTEGPIPEQLRHYADTLLTQIIQNAACGRIHSLSTRLARWLLMAHERSPTSEMQLTHQALAERLGVRREAVSNTAGVLQRQGLISYRRGILRILNRTGLESKACSCYRAMDAGV